MQISRLLLSRAAGSEYPSNCAADCLTICVQPRPPRPLPSTPLHPSTPRPTSPHPCPNKANPTQPDPTRRRRPTTQITPTAPHPTPAHHTNPLHLILCTTTRHHQPDRTPPHRSSAHHTPCHVGPTRVTACQPNPPHRTPHHPSAPRFNPPHLRPSDPTIEWPACYGIVSVGRSATVGGRFLHFLRSPSLCFPETPEGGRLSLAGLPLLLFRMQHRAREMSGVVWNG